MNHLRGRGLGTLSTLLSVMLVVLLGGNVEAQIYEQERSVGIGCTEGWVCQNNRVLAGNYGYYQCDFLDTLPPGAKVISADMSAGAMRGTLSYPTYLRFDLNQFQLGAQQQVTLDYNPACQTAPLSFSSGEQEDGLPNYVAGAWNQIGFATTAVTYLDPSITLKLRYIAGPPEFVLKPGSPEASRRVLISKKGTVANDPYFSPAAQTKDGEIDICTVSRDINNQPITSGTVYYRLLDPADPSPYVVGASDDNLAQTPAYLSASQASIGSGGRSCVALNVSRSAAGDNFQVEASRDPAILQDGYDCGPECSKSGVITAWKRVYIEPSYMFVSSEPITDFVYPDPNPNVKTSRIFVRSNKNFTNQSLVELVHSPNLHGALEDDPPGWNAFYSEVVQVMGKGSVKDANGTNRPYITVQKVSHVYGPDRTADSSLIELGDGVGRNDGTFSVNPAYIRELFASMFIDALILGGGNVRSIPNPGDIAGVPQSCPDCIPWRYVAALGKKWSEGGNAGGANLMHLLSASYGETGSNTDIYLGVTFFGSGSQYSFGYGLNVSVIFDRRIQQVVTYTGQPLHDVGADPFIVNGEVAAHELVHQFQVNRAGINGHCTELAYNSTSSCLMFRSTDGKPNADKADGAVALHAAGGATESEYVSARKLSDPLPQVYPSN